MTEAELEESLRAQGFLSPHIAHLPSHFRQAHPTLFAIVDALNLIGQQRVMLGCNRAIKLGSLDAINISTRLLIRTMTSFQGAILLIEKGMTVEAQMLIRGCHENTFWIAAFAQAPAATTAAFVRDEYKSQDSRRGVIQRVITDIPDDEQRESLRVLIDGGRPKTAGPGVQLEELARVGGLHPNFVFYKQLSADSAHPSLHSIDRYLEQDSDGNWVGPFILGPDTNGVRSALLMALQALFSTLAAFGQIVEDEPERDSRLASLFWQYTEEAAKGPA